MLMVVVKKHFQVPTFRACAGVTGQRQAKTWLLKAKRTCKPEGNSLLEVPKPLGHLTAP